VAPDASTPLGASDISNRRVTVQGLKCAIAKTDARAMRRIGSAIALTSLVCALAPAAAWAHGGGGSHSATAWRPAPTVLAAAVLGLALFARAFLELRRRGRRDHARWTHACAFLLGVAVLTAALVSPLDALAEDYLLSAHMLQHVLIGNLAPALLVLGLRGPLGFFLLPTRILRAVAGSTGLRRLLALLLRPRVSLAAWAVTLALWHVPAVYDGALARPWLHELEHVSLVFVGLLVWCQLVDPARRGALDLRGRVLYAGALFVAAHVLVHPVLLSSRVVYDAYASASHRLLGLSPLADQHLAAVVMTVSQVAALGLFLLFALRSGHERVAPALGDRNAAAYRRG
jgi:putative membrane protein